MRICFVPSGCKSRGKYETSEFGKGTTNGKFQIESCHKPMNYEFIFDLSLRYQQRTVSVPTSVIVTQCTQKRNSLLCARPYSSRYYPLRLSMVHTAGRLQRTPENSRLSFDRFTRDSRVVPLDERELLRSVRSNCVNLRWKLAWVGRAGPQLVCF